VDFYLYSSLPGGQVIIILVAVVDSFNYSVLGKHRGYFSTADYWEVVPPDGKLETTGPKQYVERYNSDTQGLRLSSCNVSN